MRNPIKISGLRLEIFPEDSYLKDTWYQIFKESQREKRFGGGWRLPTLKELRILSDMSRKDIGYLKTGIDYWSSDEVLGGLSGVKAYWVLELGPREWKWKSRSTEMLIARYVRTI